MNGVCVAQVDVLILSVTIAYGKEEGCNLGQESSRNIFLSSLSSSYKQLFQYVNSVCVVCKLKLPEQDFFPFMHNTYS